ncbi:22238_t:CDS:2 [Cetraspora pellucida]|uniref:22238_t:CDS:1 n=1 Tax=Cetraspora pellucida TaxID=1433469 RepID=A0A9N8VPG4_9GLOM|nr:22238_t:CDS:2 [Cetraspora pellucida]
METILKEYLVQRPEYNFNEFNMLQKISKGEFGIVFKSEWNAGKLVALKCLKPDIDLKYKKQFIKEYCKERYYDKPIHSAGLFTASEYEVYKIIKTRLINSKTEL